MTFRETFRKVTGPEAIRSFICVGDSPWLWKKFTSKWTHFRDFLVRRREIPVDGKIVSVRSPNIEKRNKEK